MLQWRFYIVPLLIFNRFLDVHQLRKNLEWIKKQTESYMAV